MLIIRRLIRRIAQAGQDNDVWPVALLLLAVLVPVVCLLWFMGAAMRNERFAARQRLAEVYRGQLSSFQAQLDQYWKATASQLEERARTSSPATAFARSVQSSLVDSVIVFDDQGDIAYPNKPRKFELDTAQFGAKWAGASQLEYGRKDLPGAAKVYHAIATEATNVNVAARALQAEARCLLQAGRNSEAVRLVTDVLAAGPYDNVADRQGRLIVANAELMALEVLKEEGSPQLQAAAHRLQRRVLDYSNSALAAPQRRFLIRELQRLWPEAELPTLGAEELAAEFAMREPVFTTNVALGSTVLPNVWQFATPGRRVLALLRTEKVLASVPAAATSYPLPADTQIALLPPGVDVDAAFVSVPAGPRLPGWRLGLSLKDNDLFRNTSGTALYFWTAILVLAVIAVLTLVTIRVVRRQTILARLKNDLAATVSHELKTPLSTTRVLVDTLLDAKELNDQTAREYLRLIAQENERLSRLVQNFLSFSRVEKKKYAFEFSPVCPAEIAVAAATTLRERLEAAGCRFELQVEDNVPGIMADADALTTAIINLLDNAQKYSEDIKHIVLNVRAENGRVIFAVKDNGIGIAARDVKKIFRPFYQSDRHLSRKGSGCGLGLSIVESIVSAHGGTVSVVSEPGCGSTFSISLPGVAEAESIKTELMA
jgi:signal transduction histidine kinase